LDIKVRKVEKIIISPPPTSFGALPPVFAPLGPQCTYALYCIAKFPTRISTEERQKRFPSSRKTLHILTFESSGEMRKEKKRGAARFRRSRLERKKQLYAKNAK
jgi:hypothetical protein